MNIIKRKIKGGGFNIPTSGRAIHRGMRNKITGSGVSSEMFEEIEKVNKGVNPDIVKKFEGLKLKGKPKKYISFN